MIPLDVEESHQAGSKRMSPLAHLLVGLKEAGQQAIEDTSVQGFRQIIDARKHVVLRLLWLVATLCSMGVCAFMVYYSLDGFLNWSVVTTINVVGETPSLFPVVTVCPQNPIATPQALAFSKTSMAGVPLEKLAYLKAYLQVHFLVTQTASDATVYNDTVRQWFGGSLDDTVLNCVFNLNSCNRSNFRVGNLNKFMRNIANADVSCAIS